MGLVGSLVQQGPANGHEPVGLGPGAGGTADPVLAIGATHASHQLIEDLAQALLGGMGLSPIHAGKVRRPKSRAKYYFT